MTSGGPNRSTAVMQRRVEAADSLDNFPTPGWATRALIEKLRAREHDLPAQTAWEPACNLGYMARPLAEAFADVRCTDVHDYGWTGMHAQEDFLLRSPSSGPCVDWVITNPPFKLALDFIRMALAMARVGVAIFIRTAFVEGQERYHDLFARHPEAAFMPFVERVCLWRGVLLDPDIPVWNANANGGKGGMEKPTTATSYGWFLWEKSHSGAGVLDRIAPCRTRLTRPGDYPPVPDHLRPPERPGSLI